MVIRRAAQMQNNAFAAAKFNGCVIYCKCSLHTASLLDTFSSLFQYLKGESIPFSRSLKKKFFLATNLYFTQHVGYH